MEFVSLLNGKDDVLSAYSYCKRGTDIPYNPDKIREQAELSSYNYESGNLFSGKTVLSMLLFSFSSNWNSSSTLLT